MMLLALVLSLMLSLSNANNEADVLILGAGAAGLFAANHFAAKNISFLMIEGASVISGRIRSTMFGGNLVELGTTTFYGTNASVRTLVNMYSLAGNYVEYDDVIVRTSNGTQPRLESQQAWHRLAESQRRVNDLSVQIKAGKKPDVPTRVALEYGNWFPRSPVDDVIELYKYDFLFSKIPETISVKEYENMLPYMSSPFLVSGQQGFTDIVVEPFARTFLVENDPRLKLNEVVDRISRTMSSVSVSTKSGKTFTGKYAIITFSMGVLKSRSVTFDPPLPEWKLDTIYKTSMDAYTHVYVKFASGVSKFWDDHQFILHASPRRGYYPVIWNMEADGFHPAGTNMIAFQVMAEEARRIERSDKATVKAEITDVLRKMYGPNTPEPEDILVTKWLDDPLTMGSFSSRQVGDNNPRFMDALTSPVGRLYFAGEAYHKDQNGFTKGARYTGVDTAKKLEECMKNLKCHQFNQNPPRQAPAKPVTCGADGYPLSVVAFLICCLSILANINLHFFLEGDTNGDIWFVSD